jgi:hypothetical protein
MSRSLAGAGLLVVSGVSVLEAFAAERLLTLAADSVEIRRDAPGPRMSKIRTCRDWWSRDGPALVGSLPLKRPYLL